MNCCDEIFITVFRSVETEGGAGWIKSAAIQHAPEIVSRFDNSGDASQEDIVGGGDWRFMWESSEFLNGKRLIFPTRNEQFGGLCYSMTTESWFLVGDEISLWFLVFGYSLSM